MNKITRFWQELKRRNVVRRNTVYAATAFVIIELVDIISEPFGLPEWTLKFVVVLLSIGFIVSVIISWLYDFNPEGGLEKTKPVQKIKNEDKPIASLTWKIASYISFVVIVGLVILNIIPRTNRVIEKEILDKSIAVLPFINDSPDEENAYFINGTMDAILNNLSKIEDIRVLSRTSVEQYRNALKPIPEIAKEMNVSYILEGSGQKEGNKVRLTLQLIDAINDKHLWSSPYNREIEIGQIFDLQSEIAQLVAAEIEAIISPEEKELIEKIPTTSLTAYDFYQRGREEHEKYWFDSDNREALERAEDLYHKALEYDSAFALAYIGLADVYMDKHYWETYLSENFLDSTLILADIALSYDDQLADAYVTRGNYYIANSKKEQAIKEYDKAIKFNPNSWEAYYFKGNLYYNDDCVKEIDNYLKAASVDRGPFLPSIYRSIGVAYSHAGFKEKAIYYVKEALKLDGDSAVYYYSLAEIEDSNFDFEKAIEYYGKSYTIDSTAPWVIRRIGQNHMYLDQFKESLEYYIKYEKRMKALDIPISGGPSFKIGYAYWANGFKEEAEYYFDTGLEYFKKMNELGRGPQKSNIYAPAAMYAFLGDKDKAYEYLKLLNQRTKVGRVKIKDLNNNPLFDSIRDEPEFQQIVKDIEAKYQAEHERVKRWLEENDML